MSTPWSRPIPLLLSCLGWLLAALLSCCQWIWRRMGPCCCENNNNNNTGNCTNKRQQQQEKQAMATTAASQMDDSFGGGGATAEASLLLHCSPMPTLANDEENHLLAGQPPQSPIIRLDMEEGTKSEDHQQQHQQQHQHRQHHSGGIWGSTRRGRQQGDQADECNNIGQPNRWMTATATNNDDVFESPALALLDPCTSSVSVSSSHLQHHSTGSALAPHRLASFFSKRLKRTRSTPKVQKQRQNVDKTQQQQQQHRHNTDDDGGQQQQQHIVHILRASLGSNALRTDQHQQQQRSQPLSLYLPPVSNGGDDDGSNVVGGVIQLQQGRQQALKSSRSYESLLLSAQQQQKIANCSCPQHQQQQQQLLHDIATNNAQHRLLLCTVGQQQRLMPMNSQPSLESSCASYCSNGFAMGMANGSMNNSTNGTGGCGCCWMDSSHNSVGSVRARQMNNNNNRINRDAIRRVENSLCIWVLEAKGVPAKRRFFCEISLDKRSMAITTRKQMSDGICFWGEQFEFENLPLHSQQLCVDLFREAEQRASKKSSKRLGGGGANNKGMCSQEDLRNLIGLVRIPVAELNARQPVEKWYPVSTASDGQTTNGGGSGSDLQPSLRLKARYQSVHVLPLRAYAPMREFLRTNSLPLCAAFEPILGVKAKEDFANSLVRILHVERNAPEALAELAMAEVLGQDNDHLLFRGNSLATKAMEAYMKLVARDYLEMAIRDFVHELLCSELCCEVDPLRLSSSTTTSSTSSSSSSSGGGPISAQLERNRLQLMRQVECVWQRIVHCQPYFPYPLRLLFANLRHKLEQAGKLDLADNLLSSTIFLRFLCPAILSPSLFDLIREYPGGQAARNLTLIAKSLQNLANFTRFGGKEGYMEFMNVFVEREWRKMQEFLHQISTPAKFHPFGEQQAKAVDAKVDLGKELSLLSSYLREHLQQQSGQQTQWPPQLAQRVTGAGGTEQQQQQQQQQQRQRAMTKVCNILMGISAWDYCDQSPPPPATLAAAKCQHSNGQLEAAGNNDEDVEEEDDEAAASATMFNNSSGSHNPPSDYENNHGLTAAAANNNGNGIDVNKKQHQYRKANQRHAMLPPALVSSPSASVFDTSNNNPPLLRSPNSALPMQRQQQQQQQQTHFVPFIALGASTTTGTLQSAQHLHSSDDYVLSTALAGMQTANNSGGKCATMNAIHLYDETPPALRTESVAQQLQPPPPHLYDEVAATDCSSNGRVNAVHHQATPSFTGSGGVVMAQCGVASHEAAQMPELFRPRMVQRTTNGNASLVDGMVRMKMTANEEDADESGSEEEELVMVAANKEGAVHERCGNNGKKATQGNCASIRHHQQRRISRKQRNNNNNGCDDGTPERQQILAYPYGRNGYFDGNGKERIGNSSVKPTTTTTADSMCLLQSSTIPAPPLPSSGYQSQMNSSSYSSSSSPIDDEDVASASLLYDVAASTEQCTHQNQAKRFHNNGGDVGVSRASGFAIPSALGHQFIGSCSSSTTATAATSSSSSSAYSSLSPANNDNNNNQQWQQIDGNNTPTSATQANISQIVIDQMQQQQQSPRQWAAQQHPQLLQQTTSTGRTAETIQVGKQHFQRMPVQRPRMAASSNWSLPGSTTTSTANPSPFAAAQQQQYCGQPRHAFVGSTPTDPSAAFVRYPPAAAISASAVQLRPQKFPTGNLHSPSCPSSASSASALSTGGSNNGRQITQQQRHLLNQQHNQSVSTDELLVNGGEFKMIMELKRENEELRRQLECYRHEAAVANNYRSSHASLPPIAIDAFEQQRAQNSAAEH